MPEGENVIPVRQEIPGTLQAVGVLLLRNDNKEVLLVRHKESAQNTTGIFGLPSGQIQLGETPQEAAVRELKEETGLITTEDRLFRFEGGFFGAHIERHAANPNESVERHAHWQVYSCGEVTGELKDSDETAPEWVEVSKISELKNEGALMPNVDLAIGNYLTAKAEPNL